MSSDSYVGVEGELASATLTQNETDIYDSASFIPGYGLLAGSTGGENEKTSFWRQRLDVEKRPRDSQRCATPGAPRLARGQHHPRNNTSAKLFQAVRMGFEGPQRVRTGTTATDSMAMPYVEPPLPVDVRQLVRDAAADAEALARRRGVEHDLFMPHFEAGCIKRIHRVRRCAPASATAARRDDAPAPAASAWEQGGSEPASARSLRSAWSSPREGRGLTPRRGAPPGGRPSALELLAQSRRRSQPRR